MTRPASSETMDIETLKAHVNMLKEELRCRLRQLIDLSKHPSLFVSEYFYNQRTVIDIETEQKLVKMVDDSEKSALINKIREWMIDSLIKHEDHLLEAYKQGERAPRNFPLIEQAIESRFDSDISKCHKCLDESSLISLYNYEYTAILAQIINETDKLKCEFLRNQTFFFYPTERNGFGVLVHLEDLYFSEYESLCIV